MSARMHACARTALGLSGRGYGEAVSKRNGPLAERVDLFLYDLKHADPEAHRAATGVDNKLIVANFAALLGRVGPGRVTPRVPLVPGFNTDEPAIAGLLGLLGEAGYRGEVHLMPSHGWARSKYERIGRGADYCATAALPTVELERICAVVTEHGFEAVAHG